MAETLRNLGIVAHVDAGKTTLSEQLLLLGGAIRQAGKVDEGLATMDYLREEQRRGITIRAGLASFRWKGARVNFIDTPGHMDFGMEVERSLRVLDGAIMVVCGVRGVEPRTRAIWDLCTRFDVPRLAWVNKLDVRGADFAGTVLDMEEAFGLPAIPVDWPIFVDGQFIGSVDLISWSASRVESGTRTKLEDIPAPWLDAVSPARERLLDESSRHDDEVTEWLLEGKIPTAAMVRRGLRKGVQARAFLPVCGGAALRGWNVDALLDQAILLTPPPRVPPEAKDHPGVGLVFKRTHDEGRPPISLVRMFTGRLGVGDLVRKPGESISYPVEAIHTVFADRLDPVDHLDQGDLAAIEVGGEWRCGETVLLAEGPDLRIDFETSSASFLEMAIEGKDDHSTAEIGAILSLWSEDEGNFEVQTESSTGRWIVRGQGELQLDVIVSRLKEVEGISFRCGEPHVRHRETLDGPTETKVHTATWESRSFEISLSAEPAESFEILWKTPPREGVRAAIEASLRHCAADGVRGGGDLHRLRWRLDVVRDEEIFPWVAKQLVDHVAPEMLLAAGVTKEVPVAILQIYTPLEHVGAVTHELLGRGATIQGIDTQRNGAIISAVSPLERLLGCSKLLLSLSKGQANTTLTPGGWAAESV